MTSEVPTEAMIDAPRGLFIYFRFQPQTFGGVSLGQHLAMGGYPTAGLTDEELAHVGVFPKAQCASMVWRMMQAAKT